MWRASGFVKAAGTAEEAEWVGDTVSKEEALIDGRGLPEPPPPPTPQPPYRPAISAFLRKLTLKTHDVGTETSQTFFFSTLVNYFTL